MATIQERVDAKGKKTYRVQIRIKGHPHLSATFDRKTDARNWIQHTEADIKAGRYVATPESRKRTFGDMVDRYVRDVLPRKRESTVRSQQQQMQWWKDELGDYFLGEVTPALIVEKRDKLLNGETPHGQRRSNSTVTRYLAVLSHCYSVAVTEWEWIDNSPMRRVGKPKEPSGRVRFLSDEERARLLDACSKSRNTYLYAIVMVALSTGMRRGEIMNLRWGQVDLNHEVIRLLAKETKNNTARSIPLTGPALDVLRDLAKSKMGSPKAYVFASPNANGKEKPIDIQTAWKAALQRAEIEDFRFHDLRHTAASYLAMNGATLPEIAEVLGHKTQQTTQRYAHLTESHVQEVVKSMNAKVFGGDASEEVATK